MSSQEPAVETAPERAQKSTYVDYIVLDGIIDTPAIKYVTRAGGFLRSFRRGFNRRLLYACNTTNSIHNRGAY
ncbi:MAG: hypothetical protein JWQ02_2007 [Capsulimonas sp.]|nr:hypothetical protein [Capsulimonas sp.]